MRSEKEIQVLQTVIEKAWSDSNFKEQLINSPVEAIKSAVGVDVTSPDGKELVVLDQTDSKCIYINIPPKPTQNVELTDDQLEAVAGGSRPYFSKYFRFSPIISFPKNR